MESPSGITFAVIFDGGGAVVSLLSEPQPLMNNTKQQAHISLEPKAILTFSLYSPGIMLEAYFLENTRRHPQRKTLGTALFSSIMMGDVQLDGRPAYS
jgi:hypothetical protein